VGRRFEHHLLRAKDFIDGHYAEPLKIEELAGVAGYSRAHFSRAFRSAFGVCPKEYLITRRLERAAALLRGTDRNVAEICHMVGLTGVGSFTSAFTRTYGLSPTSYRAQFPPASAQAVVPTCVVRFYTTPSRVKELDPSRRHRGTIREASTVAVE
jgi:AraC-like DNA-binding protein